MIQHLEPSLKHITSKFGKKVCGILMEDFWVFWGGSGEFLHVQPCCWAVEITQDIQFLVKPLSCTHSQLNFFSFVIAFAFSQQPLGLFPMGSITFALCFSFFLVLAFPWQVDPCLHLMNLCLSLLLFKHIFVFKFLSLGLFFLAWPDWYVRVTILFRLLVLAVSTNRHKCRTNLDSCYVVLIWG